MGAIHRGIGAVVSEPLAMVGGLLGSAAKSTKNTIASSAYGTVGGIGVSGSQAASGIRGAGSAIKQAVQGSYYGAKESINLTKSQMGTGYDKALASISGTGYGKSADRIFDAGENIANKSTPQSVALRKQSGSRQGTQIGPAPSGGGGTTQAAIQPVQAGGGPASDAAGSVGMFARRAAMGAGIGAMTSAAWGAGPGDLSLGSVAGGAAMGAVLGSAGGYGASRARNAGAFDKLAGKSMKHSNRLFGGQASTTSQGMSFVGGRQGGIRRKGHVGWGRAGMYAGAGAGGILGSWAGNSMFGNSKRSKAQNSLNHYGRMF